MLQQPFVDTMWTWLCTLSVWLCVDRVPGVEFLLWQDIPASTEWDLWKNVVALFVIAIAAFTVGYFMLRRYTILK